MDNWIKIYKDMVWCEVAFWPNIETLFWEWDIETFKQKRASCEYMEFSIHNKMVATSKIKDFWRSRDIEKITLEMKLSWLSQEQKQKVKDRMSEIKRNLWREPSDNEISRIISIVIDPTILEKEKIKTIEYEKPLSEIKRFSTYLIIQKNKIAKVITWRTFWFNTLKD